MICPFPAVVQSRSNGSLWNNKCPEDKNGPQGCPYWSDNKQRCWKAFEDNHKDEIWTSEL